MIIFELKNIENKIKKFTVIKNKNKISFKEPNIYISNVKVIDNEYDDILFLITYKNYVKYYNSKNQLHNPNGPSFVSCYENGSIFHQEYWIDGKQLKEEEFNKKKEKIKNE